MNKKQKFLVVDVETANAVDCPLVYDIGYAVADNTGRIYETNSFVINDIFYDEPELMESAYYSNKILYYLDDIADGYSRPVDFLLARYIIKDVMKRWNISTVCAYNAHFDIMALNNTLRYLTKSKYRWFFPYGTEVNCIWHMACQVLYTKLKFVKWALANNYVSSHGNIRTNAEIGYRFFMNNENFNEEHRGLEDVLIECQIMAKCYKQHKKMDKNVNRQCFKIPSKKYKEIIEKVLTN